MPFFLFHNPTNFSDSHFTQDRTNLKWTSHMLNRFINPGYSLSFLPCFQPLREAASYCCSLVQWLAFVL